MTGPQRFDAVYEGTPPWDIGRPQPVFQSSPTPARYADVSLMPVAAPASTR